MSRIFVTGDTHADIDWHKLNTKRFQEQKECTKDDVVIIAGDFGAPWTIGEDNTDKYILDTYEKRNFTTLFVDGNHENFEALNTYPTVTFAGAECHQLRPSVYHVKRGEVLHINGHKILCMGGATSTDKERRKEHISWWKEEEPSYEEWNHAAENLVKERPDIIITHDAPTEIVSMIYAYTINNPTPVQRNLEKLLNIIREKSIPVIDWYFGHHHEDIDFGLDEIRFYERYQMISKIK